MSTQYGGKAANYTPASALTITGVSAGATPTITVSGTLPATFLTGNTVDISGVQGATGVNGQNVVTVTGANTFTIPVGAPGTYTSGGSVQSLDMGTFAMPNDGDLGSAASVNVGLDANADRTAALAVGTGAYKMVTRFNSSFQPGDFTNAANISSTVNGTWADWGTPLNTLMPFLSVLGAPTTNVIAGDVAKVSVISTFRLVTNAIQTINVEYLNAIWYTNTAPGVPNNFVRASTGGSQTFLLDAAGAGSNITAIDFGMHLHSEITLANTGTFDFKIRLLCSQTLAAISAIRGEVAIAYELWRPTGFAQ